MMRSHKVKLDMEVDKLLDDQKHVVPHMIDSTILKKDLNDRLILDNLDEQKAAIKKRIDMRRNNSFMRGTAP